MSAKFTRGPWKARMNCDVMAGERLVAVCMTGWLREDRANAHLIAAAPEMYEVIEEIAEMKIADCDAHDAANYMRDAARALLAKMRGEA